MAWIKAMEGKLYFQGGEKHDKIYSNNGSDSESNAGLRLYDSDGSPYGFRQKR
jgi:hypothetical protein